jgi:hypothetical protein
MTLLVKKNVCLDAAMIFSSFCCIFATSNVMKSIERISTSHKDAEKYTTTTEPTEKKEALIMDKQVNRNLFGHTD